MSTDVLGIYLDKDKSTIYERLYGLVEQGYVQKTYDSSYRLQLKPAVYSLTAKGIKQVRSSIGDKVSETALRNMYKNHSASEALVKHSLAVAKLCLQLHKQYPGTFDIFTKSLMTDFEDFIRPLPDLYLQRKDRNTTKPDYFLETVEAGTMTWILRKRLNAHEQWRDDHAEDWGDNYPHLLFVCENDSTEKRIQKLAYGRYMDFEVYTTTQERCNAGNKYIWLHDYEVGWNEEMELAGL